MRASKAIGILIILLWGFAPLGHPQAKPPTSLKSVVVLRIIDGDTIQVQLPDGTLEKVRLMGINAPELDQCLGGQDQGAAKELRKLLGQTVWLELNPQDGGFQRGRDRRLLAYVFTGPEPKIEQLVNRQLVQAGLAKLEVLDANDGEFARNPNDFRVRYADGLIQAQISAAQGRAGWWGECDPFAASDVVIAVIKFWGDDEVVYLINRGKGPIKLDPTWQLSDKGQKHKKLFSSCQLPPNALLRVHSGPAAKRANSNCSQSEIDLFWTGQHVWDNKGDDASLAHPVGTLIDRFAY